MQRTRPRRLGLVLAAFAFMATVVLTACSESGNASSERMNSPLTRGVTSSTELGSSGTLFEPPPLAPGFTLTGEDGEPVSLSDFRGEVVAIYFGYTHCPDVCPLTLGTYKAALDGLPAEVSEQVNVVMVSVDPARDTPEVLGRYMNLFNERFLGVTGSLQEVDAVVADWDVQIRRGIPDDIGAYEVDHPAATWIVDQEGRLRVKVAHMTGTDALAADLTFIVKEGIE